MMHAAEYPALIRDAAHPAHFPFALGRGQLDSPLHATPATLAWRNVLAAGGCLASLDLAPTSPLASALLWPDLAPLATLCESDLGAWVGDVTYLVEAGVRGGGRVLAFEGPGGGGEGEDGV